MKLMYIAPRYHTNQTPIMKGLVEHGDQVCFLAHYRGKIEDYSAVEPVIVGYSRLYLWFDALYVRLCQKRNPMAGDKKLKSGFPKLIRLYREMKKFVPELVILRERSVYSMVACLLCRWKHYPAILYNQSPLYDKAQKNDLAHRLVRALSPTVRITPVLGNKQQNNWKDPDAVYVPFVMEPKLAPEEKMHVKDAPVRIFAIGKYEERKNHLLLLSVCARLQKEYAFELVLAGECSTSAHRQYLDRLTEAVKGQGMEKRVTILQNLSRIQVEEEYKKADLFVIPSTREPASISQLEAMAFSLPVICSDTNGTACYVEDGVNGYLFRDNKEESLEEKLRLFLSNQALLKVMGAKSYALICEKYGFDSYLEAITKIMETL